MKVTPETRRQHYIIPLIYLAFQYFGITVPDEGYSRNAFSTTLYL